MRFIFIKTDDPDVSDELGVWVNSAHITSVRDADGYAVVHLTNGERIETTWMDSGKILSLLDLDITGYVADHPGVPPRTEMVYNGGPMGGWRRVRASD